MNKYNEIMSNVTVDPEMKSRIMSAVSAAIREQAEGSAIVTEINRSESADMKSGADIDSGSKKSRSDSDSKKSRSDSDSGKLAKLTRSGPRPSVRSADPIHSDSKSADSKGADSKSAESKRADSKRADSGAEDKPRRKANRTPIVVFSSIAAAILVLAGVAFIFSKMNTTASRPASDTQAKSDSAVAEGTVAGDLDYSIDINYAVGGDSYFDAAEGADEESDGAPDYNASSVKDVNEETTAGTEAGNSDDRDLGGAGTTTGVTTVGDYDEGIGDDRIDRISRALPFDLKGNGAGVFADNITTEVFFGEGGEKVLLLTAPADVDLLAAYAPSVKTAGETLTSPNGTSVTFYHIEFGNVASLESDEIPTEVNAAYFVRDGKTYLLVFSDVQATDVMLGVVDAV